MPMTASRHKNNREFDANQHPTGRLPDALQIGSIILNWPESFCDHPEGQSHNILASTLKIWGHQPFCQRSWAKSGVRTSYARL